MTSPFSLFINSHLAWLPLVYYSSLLADLSVPILQQDHTVTPSRKLNVWIIVSQTGPHDWQRVRIASPLLSGPRHSRRRFKTSRSWSVCVQGINLLWHANSPLRGCPVLGSSPVVPVAARVMQGVRKAGMDGESGYGGMEVNKQKEQECWDAGSAEGRQWTWEGIREMDWAKQQ